MESPSAGSYHPTQSPNQHNTSSHQPVPVHTTQPSPAPSGSKEWAKLLVTRMEEQEYNNSEIENRKTYLENRRSTWRSMKAQINKSASHGSTDYNKQPSAQTLHSELLS